MVGGGVGDSWVWAGVGGSNLSRVLDLGGVVLGEAMSQDLRTVI